MKRIKEVFSNLHDIWKVPKYKGLIQLGFWILFFIFVAVFVRMKQSVSIQSNTNNNNNNEEVEEKTTVTSYIYNYQINDNGNTLNISGTYYKGIDLFNFNNMRYYIKDNQYYNALDNTSITFDYSLIDYQYNKIEELIKNREYESKTEYKDKTIEYTYIIDANTYNNYYNRQYESNGNIKITVKFKDDYIINCSIDLSEYFVDKNNYSVVIDYTNIDNVGGLDINIE